MRVRPGLCLVCLSGIKHGCVSNYACVCQGVCVRLGYFVVYVCVCVCEEMCVCVSGSVFMCVSWTLPVTEHVCRAVCVAVSL